MNLEKLTVKEIVEKDIEALYLGNLRTVEFDLNLPTSGKNDSNISWKTKDERFITIEGKVTRSSYGKGDRVIDLTATFEKDGYEEQKIYSAKVLEEENNIVVAKVYPIEIIKGVGEEFYLPQVVSIQTDKNEVIGHAITWNDGEKRKFDKPGHYEVSGFIKDTKYGFKGTVIIEEIYEPKKIRESSS